LLLLAVRKIAERAGHRCAKSRSEQAKQVIASLGYSRPITASKMEDPLHPWLSQGPRAMDQGGI
jgi:hypothetical protein